MRVCFRATFAGPKGPLNPSGWNAPKPAPQQVELFRRGENWYAREPKSREVFHQLAPGPTHGTMKDTVAQAFDKQLSEWEIFDSEGNPLDLHSIVEDEKGEFTRYLETHAAAPDQIGQPGNVFKAICGEVVGASRIRSRRSHVAPDCKVCREEWERVKQEDRIA